jgi:hypothetical protein
LRCAIWPARRRWAGAQGARRCSHAPGATGPAPRPMDARAAREEPRAARRPLTGGCGEGPVVCGLPRPGPH